MLQSFDGHKAVHYQELDPGNEWVKDSDIAINSNGPLDSGGVYTPNVIKQQVHNNAWQYLSWF